MQPGTAMLQCLLGLECQDFVMIAADQTATKNVFILKNDVDKVIPISDNMIMGVNGDNGDVLQFAHYVTNNISLYKLKNGYQLNAAATVHFTRKSLVDAYRSSSPYMLNLMLGGWDPVEGGQLYLLDSLGTGLRVPYAAHGFGGMFGISILGSNYHRNMTESYAYAILQACVREIHQRLFLNLPNFQVKLVSKDGISTLPIICPEMKNL